MCDKACANKLLQPGLAESTSGQENCNERADSVPRHQPVALVELCPCIEALWPPVTKPGSVCFEAQMELSTMSHVCNEGGWSREEGETEPQVWELVTIERVSWGQGR